MTDTAPHSARRRWPSLLLGAALLLALVITLGPRNAFGPDMPTSRPQPPQELTQLDAWLAEREAAVPGLRPDVAKRITWHAHVGQVTPWAVVYVHGFSASRLETEPLAYGLAQALGANLFETRLTGHGQNAQALGEATAQDWLADTEEALALGRRLGQRVLFLSVSTGGTLATWMGMRPEGREGVVHVMMSPNFGPRHPLAEVVNWPWGRQLARWIEGDMRGPQPRNAAEAQAWTSPYPTQAVFPMMALVKQVRQSDLSAFTAPVLVLYAEGDQTVDPAQTKAAFARLGSAQKTLLRVDDSESPGQHVLAGERLAPRSTGPIQQRILAWVTQLPR
ncbi:MAG: alpha/beta hydrolase [Limnohabitans sp.]|nr:alpha/beta hydrolase [Limnohabitans sp.]